MRLKSCSRVCQRIEYLTSAPLGHIAPEICVCLEFVQPNAQATPTIFEARYMANEGEQQWLLIRPDLGGAWLETSPLMHYGF